MAELFGHLKIMNLTLHPWVPVRWLDGHHGTVGLQELFLRASEIADLDAAPHERVSLMRLLVCITQAACGAPEDAWGWDGFAESIGEKSVAYLGREDIAPHFALFGDGPRFLQVKVPVKEDAVPSSKLIPHLATGNNPTLLDHGAGEGRALPPDMLARALLTFQCFYPLYGAGYKGKGPCVDGNMIHTLLVGRTLQETIVRNCLDQETIGESFGFAGMGRPLWELSLGEESAEEVATCSYLGRLVPRHRDLWLLDDGTGFYLRQQSYLYPTHPDTFEPSCTRVQVTKGKETEERVLSARVSRALWRDLQLMTTLPEGKGSRYGAPLVLRSHHCHLKNGHVDFWAGALITDLKAKILDTVESSFTVPHAMFTPEGRTLYAKGIEYADAQRVGLYYAVKGYAERLKQEKPPIDRAEAYFWHALDQQRQLLLDLVEDSTSLGLTDFGAANDPWSVAVQRAAHVAYAQTCPSENPRQKEAYVIGLRSLRPRKAAAKKAAKKKAENANQVSAS